MKINVKLTYPRIEVSKQVEVGNVKNNELNKTQSKLVDQIVDELSPQLYKKMKNTNPKVVIKS